MLHWSLYTKQSRLCVVCVSFFFFNAKWRVIPYIPCKGLNKSTYRNLVSSELWKIWEMDKYIFGTVPHWKSFQNIFTELKWVGGDQSAVCFIQAEAVARREVRAGTVPMTSRFDSTTISGLTIFLAELWKKSSVFKLSRSCLFLREFPFSFMFSSRVPSN